MYVGLDELFKEVDVTLEEFKDTLKGCEDVQISYKGEWLTFKEISDPFWEFGDPLSQYRILKERVPCFEYVTLDTLGMGVAELCRIYGNDHRIQMHDSCGNWNSSCAVEGYNLWNFDRPLDQYRIPAPGTCRREAQELMMAGKQLVHISYKRGYVCMLNDCIVDAEGDSAIGHSPFGRGDKYDNGWSLYKGYEDIEIKLNSNGYYVFQRGKEVREISSAPSIKGFKGFVYSHALLQVPVLPNLRPTHVRIS